MTSSFAWLDFSDADRRKALDVIDLFRDKGTVDELGLGTVRDAFANLLFPGTSTIMTRARYYLFVPWIYLRQEERKTPSNEIALRARNDEIMLIEALVAGGESKGVIGIDARASLKRLPSTVYWQGLGTWRIRRFSGSAESYHRALDAGYRRAAHALAGDDKELVAGGRPTNWDPHLPPMPSDLLKVVTLRLTRAESRYLQERIMQAATGSLLAFLVDREATAAGIGFPWEHPLFSDLPDRLRTEVIHAREFSAVTQGAALLYNLMLAEKLGSDEWTTGYSGGLEEWAANITNRSAELGRWDRAGFWHTVDGTGARVPSGTRLFVDKWLDLSLKGDPARLHKLPAARTLVANRERVLKGPLARLDNLHALNQWNGASFTGAMDYRWNRPVRDLLEDIRTGLGH